MTTTTLASGTPPLVQEASAPVSVSGLTKRFGSVVAVDDLSFTVERGQVCGFLGPNGAGKTTTLRCLLGLIRPTGGSATIHGARYVDLPKPLCTVGAVLDTSGFHPSRTARNHLDVIAIAAGIEPRRVDEVLDLVGLQEAAGRRVGAFSTGMRQRLGLAAALLGDPEILVLDEPATGLDPAGINWLRAMLRHIASTLGKSVLVSSHLLGEMEQTADHIVIIARGRLVRQGSLQDIIGQATRRVAVSSPDLDHLASALTAAALTFHRVDQALIVDTAEPALVGHLAFVAGIELSALSAQHTDLEEVFLALTDPGGLPTDRPTP